MTFLDDLGPEERTELEAVGVHRAYPRATTLLHAGDDAGPVIVLLAGRVKVAAPPVAGGAEAMIALRGPGEILGELGAVDDAPRAGTVTTLEPVRALVVPRAAFRGLVERRPRIALVILRLVVARLRYADAQQAQFATHDVTGRVAHRIAELADRYGTADGDRIELLLPITQEELASWTGAAREAVSKALQQLRVARVLDTSRRRITVLDAEALRRRGA
jgi:CRP-like cAMP-binding protein